MGNGILSMSIGKAALAAHQAALDVTSQNLANANTEGYARKVVNFSSTSPFYAPEFEGPTFESQIGTGVQVERIKSVRDLFLNGRIRDVSSRLNGAEKEEDYLRQVELLFSGEIDTSALMDDFFNSLHDLAANPESLTVRSVVRENGEALAEGMRLTYEGLEEVRGRIDEEIRGTATEVNGITSEIALLNDRIAASRSANLNPNDFEDRRQVLLEDLSEYGDIQVVPGVVDTVTVLFGGQTVVNGTQSYDIEAVSDSTNQNMAKLRIEGSAAGDLVLSNGGLAGMVEIRDTVIPDLYDDLDELAITLVDRFNAVHRTGFGLAGSTGVNFFEAPDVAAGETRVFSTSSSVYVEDTATALDGDSSTTAPENFETNPIGSSSFVINNTSISYDASVDSLEDIAARVNASGANATAYITPENRIVFTGTRLGGYEIQNLYDNGNLLERLGILTSGSTFPSSAPANADPSSILQGTTTLVPESSFASSIRVSDEVRADLSKIAAARGEDLSAPPDGIGEVSRGPGDGALGLDLAQLASEPTMTNGTATFGEFYTEIVGKVGARTSFASRTRETYEAQGQNLKNLREEVQGVSIDEEMVNLIKFQRGFQAASRIIRAADEVLQTLISLGQ